MGPGPDLKFLHRSAIDLRVCISNTSLSKHPISLSSHCCCPRCYHADPLFTPQYWFPLKLSFEFRILPTTFKALQALTPLFLYNLVHISASFRNLLSVSHLSLLSHHFLSWLCQNRVLLQSWPQCGGTPFLLISTDLGDKSPPLQLKISTACLIGYKVWSDHVIQLSFPPDLLPLQFF